MRLHVETLQAQYVTPNAISLRHELQVRHPDMALIIDHMRGHHVVMSCPQGLENQENCCAPVLSGEKLPETPEQLMRARYCAYATQNIDFVYESHHPERRDEVDREGAENWSKQAEWNGLEILRTEGGGPSDSKGKVEFIARYTVEGSEYKHHEVALFDRVDNRWYFTDGEMVKAQPNVREGRKIGRNEVCPLCDSGKKYKRCCARG